MPAHPVTADEFDATVRDHPMVLVDFWAGWCRPCLQFAPTYEAASDAHPDIHFASVDTESERSLSSAAQVSSIPTLMAFKDGVLVFRQAGALPPEALEQLIAGLRALDMSTVPTD